MAVEFLNFENKHTVAESSKLKATIAGHIYNIKISKNLDNGSIVAKGNYVEPEVYAEKASTGFAGKIIDVAGNGAYLVEVVNPGDAILLLQVPLIYEEYTTIMQAEWNFFNKKDDIVRGYELHKGDIFALSKEGFASTPAPEKGKTVTVGTDFKLVVGN